MSIPFSKMSGAGNTFVVIDNREGVVESTLAELALTMDALVIRICSTVTGVGSDGLILIENTADYDFAWRFFNSDGSHANMCGNGARCAARFASMEGISGITAAFETGAGVVHSEVQGERVRVTLTDPGEITPDIELTLAGDKYRCHRIDTGVPHLVVPVDSVNDVDIVNGTNAIGFNQAFTVQRPAAAGTVTYCFVIAATDEAVLKDGTDTGNSSSLASIVSVTWN